MSKYLSLTIISVLMLVFVSTNTYSQTKVKEAVDTSKCLEFIGNFDGTVKDMDGNYTAKLIRDNKVVEEVTLPVNKSFRFVLRRNMLYAVRVEKQGYISKMLSITTKLPNKLELENLYTFKLETNLISQDLSSQFKDDDVDFPVALVSYGKKCDCFEYNREYTTKLISSMYNNLLFGN